MENTIIAIDSSLEARLRAARESEAKQLGLRVRIQQERKILIPLLLLAFAAWLNIGVVHVDGHSMEPTFHTGDALIILKSFRRFSPLKVGDIVVIHVRHGKIAGEEIVKRVVFLQNAAGNAALPENIRTSRGMLPAETLFPEEASGRYVLPAGAVLVMGDNFMNSMDSRDFGPILDSEIDGKVILH